MKKEFYEKVAELLETTHVWSEPVARRTRWNTRFLGNGRYPGHGIVRWFSPVCIHVALNVPQIQNTFKSEDEALAAIRAQMDIEQTQTQE